MDGWMALLVRKRSSGMIRTSPERNGFLTDGGLDDDRIHFLTTALGSN